MKRLVLILFSVFLLFSCLSTEKKSKEVKTLEQALVAAGNCPNAKDSLFLGFNFGMDSCETVYVIDSLIKTGKLFYQDSYLRYKFNISPLSYSPAVGFVYSNDTLSKISLAFFNEENQPIELIQNAITANIFKTLSGKGYKSYQEKNISGINDYYFIKNNTLISLKAYERFVIMSYSNAIIEQQEKQKKDSQTKQTLSDL